jgi:hypothetical protein
MTELWYSPLEPRQVQTAIQSHISSTPYPRSWELFPLRSDGLYYGTVTETGFDLALADGSRKGNPLLEISGLIQPAHVPNVDGYLIKLHYQTSSANKVAWPLMLSIMTVFLSLVLLNFRTTGRLSGSVIIPAFVLPALLFFALVYKAEVNKSRRFLSTLLQLQTAP